jgi:hypothetical protein
VDATDGLGNVLETFKVRTFKSISIGRRGVGKSDEGGPISRGVGYNCPGSDALKEARVGKY